MEPRKIISSEMERYRPDVTLGALRYFEKACDFAFRFYKREIDSIASTKFENVSEDLFFREYIWVVHATGFSARVVGSFMPRLLEAYGSIQRCSNQDLETVIEEARKVVNNPPKIKAVWTVAGMLYDNLITGKMTWPEFKRKYLSSPEALQELPYIGKITCYHLARNLGLLEFVKPDLHLVRMAKYWCFTNCIEMCIEMQANYQRIHGTLLPLGIVDLILWYTASTFGTLDIRVDGDR